MTTEAAALLAWYDRHARDLPWRAKVGQTPDPYHVWLSEIMLQQTTVAAVKGYFARFLSRLPDVESLAAASPDTVMQLWSGLGYYSRARNLHACAKTVVAAHGGRFPDTEEALLRLPGIGPYTAAAIAAIAFNRKAAAIDGNVERVISRFRRIETPLPAARPLIRAETLAIVPEGRSGDFAQALMDLGAMVCTPRSPACALCPWAEPCRARAAGDAGSFPRKQPKRTGQTRRGVAYVLMREDGALLLRTRPPKGLLGGMAEVPTSDWLAGDRVPAGENAIRALAPMAADWRRLPGHVRHVFTHFPLELTVLVATAPADTTPPDGLRFTPRHRLADEPLSTLMRKVIACGLEALVAR
jgi:A/G-specific adenine glycosylase